MQHPGGKEKSPVRKSPVRKRTDKGKRSEYDAVCSFEIEKRSNAWGEIAMLLLIILLVLLFGGGGGYYGYSRWGRSGGLGILGTVLLIVLIVYLVGGLR